MNTKNKQHANSGPIAEISNKDHQEVETKPSKTTKEEAKVVISNSNIKLFMKK
ncbi:hypothetical protein [Aeromonas sp. MrichA-1]|uniref:hypothetical protein n=1 Tax=Aeromonas sp. MrichA-1 TaxID=2823362 RepID=UPI001B335A86|nr:hypothetical protein [Aeromonas sp. MrichA-1]MBP4081936.1 hypothetical protein [Aeromonas sp. MrichA-1]